MRCVTVHRLRIAMRMPRRTMRVTGRSMRMSRMTISGLAGFTQRRNRTVMMRTQVLPEYVPATPNHQEQQANGGQPASHQNSPDHA